MPGSTRARRLNAMSLLLTAVLTTTVLSTAAAAEAADKGRRHESIHQAVRVARNQIGDPYNYGSAGPNSFDCSGLTQYAYSKAGLHLPRTSDAQAAYVRRIQRRNMHRGDLVFFQNRGDVYHLGIFMKWKNGRRIILHSSYPGRPVQRDPIWSNNWFAGTLRPRH